MALLAAFVLANSDDRLDLLEGDYSEVVGLVGALENVWASQVSSCL